MQLINSENLLSHDFLSTIRAEVSDSAEEDKFLAVDTEFIREGRDNPLLCLIQISTAYQTFILDALTVDISFLTEIFGDKSLPKVFHSARQDIEILSNHGINLENFYDTQLYEMLLDTKVNASYGSLVSKYLGRKLKKHYSMSDWMSRPLSRKQLLYCEEDVTYLREVYKKQLKELASLDRLNWLHEELQQLKNVEPEIEKSNALPSFVNENNANIFRQLFEWRKEKAEQVGIAPKLIANDEIIKSICKRGVDFVCSMKNSRIKKNAYMEEFISFAEKISENLEIKSERSEKNSAINLLKTLLEISSRKNNIAMPLIATTEDLENLLSGNKTVRCLFGWRNEIFGKDAISLLNGDLSFCIRDSEVLIRRENR